MTAAMLDAALDRSDAAVAAWRQITAAGGLHSLDTHDQWLAPAAYRNLRTLHVAETELASLRATYRHHWLKNSLALHECVRLIATRTSGVVVGSAAVALTLVAEHGAYPISTVEVVSDAPATAVGRARWAGHDIAVAAPRALVDKILQRKRDWDARSRWLWVVAAVGVVRAHPELDWSHVRDDALTHYLGTGA